MKNVSTRYSELRKRISYGQIFLQAKFSSPQAIKFEFNLIDSILEIIIVDFDTFNSILEFWVHKIDTSVLFM